MKVRNRVFFSDPSSRVQRSKVCFFWGGGCWHSVIFSLVYLYFIYTSSNNLKQNHRNNARLDESNTTSVLLSENPACSHT
jgi:hypothetical protein